MSLELQDFKFVTDDSALSDLSNKTAMESNGWVFAKDTKKPKKGCGTGKWYDKVGCGSASWYCSGHAKGSITTIFKGSGLATLKFGNCYTRGKVEVLLNGVTKGTAKKRARKASDVKIESISFEFSPGDELKIMESPNGMITLKSFKVERKVKGKSINHRYY